MMILTIYLTISLGNKIEQFIYSISKAGKAEFFLEKALVIFKQKWSKENKKAVSQILALSWKRFNLHPTKILAVWGHESGFKFTVVSKPNFDGSYDTGLGQINSNSYYWIYSNAKDFIVKNKIYDMYYILKYKNLKNVRFNALLSAIHLGGLNKQFNNNHIAMLTTYNSGKPRQLYGKYLLYYNKVMKNYFLIVNEDNNV
jgi:soluble lytic murein transglycosylase-like protein